MRYLNIAFSDKTLSQEQLILDSKEALYRLGPDLTLRECNLVLKVPAKRLLLSGPRLSGCLIEVKRELKNLPWYTASLKGCRLTGRMSGNDFGHWPNGTGLKEDGEIEDCDFTAAILDGCRFIGCDMRSIRLPRWPCFTLLEPCARREELAAFKWPGDVKIAMDFSWDPETTRAVTYLAPALAKQFKSTEEELKAALLRLDGVVL